MFPSEAEARDFARRMASAAVPEIKAGMSVEEVERLLGVPSTKASIGERLVYKYQNMTVEFVGGRVTDVH